MTDAIYPQVRVAPARLLNPETVEQLLNLLACQAGIRRILLKGQSLPAVVPYGPARGEPNPHSKRQTIVVQGEEIELRTHVGTIVMDRVDRDDAGHPGRMRPGLHKVPVFDPGRPVHEDAGNNL